MPHKRSRHLGSGKTGKLKQLTSLILLFLTLSPAAPAENRSLRLLHDCTSPDPKLAATIGCYRLMTDVFEGLVRIGADGNPEPGVAERWYWDFGRKTLTFDLKQDRKWSDGTPVVAEDFALSWRRVIADPHSGNALRKAVLNIKGANTCDAPMKQNCVSGIKVVDDHTLKVEFEYLDRLFPLRTLNGALMPVPSHFVRQHGEQQWLRQPSLPFNGAYQIKPEQQPLDDTIATLDLDLVPNSFHPDVTDQNIKAGTYIHYKKLENPRIPIYAQMRAMRELVLSKQIPDIIFQLPQLREEYLLQFVRDNGWKTASLNSVSTVSFALNQNTLDPELVKAIKWLLYSEEVLSRLGDPIAQPATRLFDHPSAQFPFNNRYHLRDYNESIANARALLEQLSISPDKRRTITLAQRATPKYERIATVLSAILGREGIDIEKQPPQTLREMRETPSDALIVKWMVSLPDPSGFFFLMDRLPFPTLPEEKEYQMNELIQQAQLLPDADRRQNLHQAEELLINDGALIPLFHPRSIAIYNEDLCGVTGNQSLTSPLLWIRWCDDPDVTGW